MVLSEQYQRQIINTIKELPEEKLGSVEISAQLDNRGNAQCLMLRRGWISQPFVHTSETIADTSRINVNTL